MTDERPDEIAVILADYRSGILFEIAESGGLSVMQGTRRLNKEELAARMRERFFARERVLGALRRLDARERAVLDRLLLRGGKALTRSLRREVIEAGLASEGPSSADAQLARSENNRCQVPYALPGSYCGHPQRVHSAVFEDVIARLTQRGLVFSCRPEMASVGGNVPKLQYHPATVIYVPRAIQECLPRPVPLPALPPFEPGRCEQGEPDLLLRDLYLYWDYVRQHEVPLIQNGLVGKRSLRAINAILLAPDSMLEQAKNEEQTERLAMLHGLLHRLGLVLVEGNRLRAVPGDGAHLPEFWRWPQPRQLGACLEAWPHLGGCAELDGQAWSYGAQLGQARRALLRALQSEPAGRWVELNPLLDKIYLEDENFLFPDHSKVATCREPWYYVYACGQSAHPAELLARFEELERIFVRGALLGFLREVGAVELGHAGERFRAARLSPLGRAMLGLPADPTFAVASEGSDRAARLVIQPNFEILALGPVSLSLLAEVDAFAERERADRGAFQYRLTRDSVYRAQQAGRSTEEIVRFLEQAAATVLPQNVRRSLEEWGAHHERIVFRSGVSLLQAANPELLSELLHEAQTGTLLARAVAADVAFVADRGEDRLLATLVEQGLFPAVSVAEPADADHSVLIREDGAIRALHAVPSLHLRGRLARLAQEELTPEGICWRLTPTSVRRAGANRQRVVQLLDELQSLSSDPLPQKLVTQIKAWAGYYGGAVAATLTLIEFRDQATMAELAQLPELQGRLKVFPAGERALARVPADELPAVQEILARFGVQVKEGL